MNELNLGVLWDRLVRGWVTPAVAAGFLALFALIGLASSKPVYSVHMLILPAPAEQQMAGAAAGTLSTLFGLGGGGQGSNYVRYQSLLFSNAVAQRMQDKYDMLHYVFRGQWDSKNHRWIQVHTLRGDLTAPLLRWANTPVWTPPDVTDLAAFLRSSLIVIPSTANDIVDVSMNDWDVAFATRVMLTANEEANAVLRDQIARRARQQVDYLQRRLAETTVEDYRQTLLALLSSEEKTLMLTQTDASFAAEIISPPIASPHPISPRPVLTIVVAILVGVISGSGIVVFLGPDWWRWPTSRLRTLFKMRSRGKMSALRS